MNSPYKPYSAPPPQKVQIVDEPAPSAPPKTYRDGLERALHYIRSAYAPLAHVTGDPIVAAKNDTLKQIESLLESEVIGIDNDPYDPNK